MEKRAEPCYIPISTLKSEKMKLFHKYWVFLAIK